VVVKPGLAALDEAPKAWLAGTHRTVAPEATLERFLPLAPRMGITRLSDVTGLDRLGLPVWMACRPNSRSLAVSQGKGLTHAAAKASAFMESAETWHAESVALPMRYLSQRDLAAQADVVGIDGLPLSRHGGYHPDRPILWVEGRGLSTGTPVWLPLELVGADFTDPPPAGSGCFAATTNGLASGNSLTEAIAHGLYEVIERDALSLWRLKGGPALAATRIDPASLTGEAVASVMERFDRAGMDVGIWDVTSDIGVPVFQCVIAGREAGLGDGDLFDAELGSGCHPDPEVALLRALTEAAQARTTFIAGSRDDFAPDAWKQDSRSSRRQSAREWLDGAGRHEEPRDFRALVSNAGPTVRGDLAWTAERVAAAGIGPVLYADLTRPDLGLPVARVVVPGLEGAFRGTEGDFVPGRRARAIMEPDR
jgi:ribosomal protein S12 methylthiotransferase accessory factor